MLTSINSNDTEYKKITGLTVQQFDQLVEPFETHYSRDQISAPFSSLPTPKDHLFFILSYMKLRSVSKKATDAQAAQATRFGMKPSTNDGWTYRLLPALRATMKNLDPTMKSSGFLLKLAQQLDAIPTRKERFGDNG
jgi:hypothetical protein